MAERPEIERGVTFCSRNPGQPPDPLDCSSLDPDALRYYYETVMAYSQRVQAEAEELKAEREKLKALLKKEDGKHTWGLSNALKFPARLYTKDVFLANQPFILLTKKKPACALVDRRGTIRMKPSTLRYAMRKTLSSRLAESEALYEGSKTELTTRPWHLALVEGLRRLTVPSLATFRDVDDAEAKLKIIINDEAGEPDEYSDDEVEPIIPRYERDPPTKLDLRIELPSQDVPSKLISQEEETEGEEENVEEKSGTSTSRQSMRSAHEEMNIKVRHVKKGQSCWCYVLVIECKHSTTWTEHSVFQALKYACDRGLINLEDDRMVAIHIMVVTESEWSYAVLDIHGAVDLEETGEFGWFARIPEHKRSEQKNDESLKKLLHDRRQFLRKYSKLVPGLDYSPGIYLVGDVYIDPKRRKLPKAESIEKFTNLDALLFYETLLRTIVGDKVLNWTKDDVKEALMVRKNFKKRKCYAITNEGSDVEDDQTKRSRTF